MTFFHVDTVPVATGTVSVAFTDRRLDLGDLAADDVRAAGLAEVAAATGATPYLMHQVHGTAVHVVTGPDGAFPDADALVTAEAGVALLARAADCVPVLLVADDGRIAAVHAGREGVRRGVVPATLAALGRVPVRAWVGPHICGGCYEVPEEMRAEVAAAVPATHASTTWGTPALDLGAGVLAQLAEAGVPATEVGGCTREDDTLHSHRRDGAAAGRLAGVVWRHP
ncbi:laccase [Nocardioides sp. MAH-18]|uniref:Laccase n=1 Tax=Nocardioides agri TaxID=2682843 RepID=A0A6L6XXH0_9ACTN|nr:polyphenol oxidase family protein [Nocardioides sp. CGMCC 1.13656]MBA2952320.1 polyphenol oxidase family protein [Nocardioides sp. CGMCC 1.13656]MVQ51482.1 laccase [Nocardioides sp. MAH-18]